jgi:hypothetical protein
MEWRPEHFAGAAQRLDDAVDALRARVGATELGYFFQPSTDLPKLRRWLGRLANGDKFGHGVPPTFGLLFAQAWQLAFPGEALPAFPDGTHDAEGSFGLDGQTTVWFGDTLVPGDLSMRAPLVVLGSLTVEGRLDDGDVFDSYLAVAGDLRARAICSGADNLALGSITADVIFCYNNDGTLAAGRDLSAGLFVPAEHAYVCHGTLRALPLGEGYRSDVAAEQVAPWVPEDYVRLGDEDPLDDERILDEAGAGRSPVLAQPRTVTFPTPPPLLDALAAPAGVSRLDLTSERLHALPGAISSLTELTHLDLEHTPLTALDGIAAVPSLQWLSIRSTPVRSLSALADLPQLAYLDISYSPDITDWPVILQLPALSKLVAYRSPMPAEIRAALTDKLGAGLVDS